MGGAVWQEVSILLITVILLAHLASAADPEILTKNETHSVQSGESVWFPCDVRHQGAHAVRWTFLDHGVTISENLVLLTQQGDRYSILHPEGGDGMWKLKIDRVVAGDAGHYRCNVDGFPLIQVIHTLIITDAPTKVIPSDIPSVDFTSCCNSYNVSVACRPVCHPSSLNLNEFDAVSNCKNDLLKLLHCGVDNRNHVPCCRRRFVPDHCLAFCVNDPPPVSQLDGYQLCLSRATDIVACFEEGQLLLPGSPHLVSGVANGKRQIFISWETPLENGDTVTDYRVFYKQANESLYRSSHLIKATQMNYIIEELKPATKYNVYITAINNHGSSLPSHIMVIITAPEETSIPVEDSTLGACCAKRKVTLPCQQLLCSGSSQRATSIDIMNCFNDMDEVFKCIAAERDHTSCCIQRNIPVSCHPLCKGQLGEDTVQKQPLSTLQCLTNYMPQINSCFQEGMNVIPGPPNNIQVFDVTDSSVEVRWNPPGELADLVKNYIIRYAENNSQQFTEMSVSQTHAELVNLKPGHMYKVEVIAQGEQGTSLPTPTIVFLTYIAPGKVSDGVITSVTAAPPQDIKQCCISDFVETMCQKYCDYDVMDNNNNHEVSELIRCAHRLGTALACGADGRNHTDCCVRRGVPKVCQPLCGLSRDQGRNLTVTYDHVICIASMHLVIDCMEEGKELIPSAPADLVVSKVTSSSISLRWSAPKYTSKSMTGYLLMYREMTAVTSPTSDKMVRIPLDEQAYIIQNLRASTDYGLRILAMSSHGNSLPSPIIIQKTSPEVEPPTTSTRFNMSSPVEIMQCCNKQNVSTQCLAACSGTQVVYLNQCSADFGKVLSCAADEGDHTVCCRRRNVPPECHDLCAGRPARQELSSLICVAFIQEIYTCFEEGYSRLPSRPQNFHLRSQNARSLEFGWEKPLKNPENVQYRLYYKKGKDSPDINFRFMEDVKNPYTLEQLEPFAEYVVYIIAANSMGASLPSNELVVRTTRETPPEISVIQEPSGYVAVDASVTLKCVTNGQPPATVHWKHGNKSYPLNRAEVKLDKVQKSDTGRWTCYANNSRASNAHDLILKVQYAPEVVVPKKQLVIEPNTGEQPVLQCNFKGFPTEVHWFQGSREILPGKDVDYRFRETSKINEDEGILEAALVIELLTLQDYGEYQCKGVNQFSSAEGQIQLTNPYKLPETPPPTFSPQPKYPNVTACCIDAGVVDSTCLTACTFDIDLTILERGKDMIKCLPSLPKLVTCAADGRDHSKCCDTKKVPAMCHPFCAGLAPLDNPEMALCLQHVEAIVDCMESGSLTIPSQPRDVSARLTDEGFVEVWWLQPINNRQMIQSYIIHYSSQASGMETAEFMNDPSKPLTHTMLQGIHSYTDYTIFMEAKNHHGKSQQSNVAQVKTYELAPSAPRSLMATSEVFLTIFLTWDVPLKHPGGVLYYKIYYRQVGSRKPQVATSTPTKNKISNLKPNTKYEIWVTAKSSHFESDVSNIVIAETGDPARMVAPPPGRSNTGVGLGVGFAVIIILVVAAVAAFYYFRVRKPPIPEMKETVSFENPGYATTEEARVHVGGVSGMADAGYQPSNGHLSSSSIMKEAPPSDGGSDNGYHTLAREKPPLPAEKIEEPPYATLDVTQLNRPPVDEGNVNMSFDEGASNM